MFLIETNDMVNQSLHMVIKQYSNTFIYNLNDFVFYRFVYANAIFVNDFRCFVSFFIFADLAMNTLHGFNSYFR